MPIPKTDLFPLGYTQIGLQKEGAILLSIDGFEPATLLVITFALANRVDQANRMATFGELHIIYSFLP